MPTIEIGYNNIPHRNQNVYDPRYLGRNGYGIQTGVSVEGLHRFQNQHMLRLTATNSKGVGRCFLEVPIAQAQEMATAILEVVRLLEQADEVV